MRSGLAVALIARRGRHGGAGARNIWVEAFSLRTGFVDVGV